MQFGVVFPQTEIGADPVGVRDYAQAVEGMGYRYLLAFDHVLGANVANRPDWPGPYTHKDLFHEPFVLFGYLAGLTQSIDFVTGILILPQRQTALVAKQAAEVDVLSGGRLRLGIGIGWNYVEYESLSENFRNRGKRSEEQIEVMRALWSNELVSYEGKWHKLEDVGINPLPVQRPIPVWFGGGADATLHRIARMGDGWLANIRPDDNGKAVMERLHGYLEDAGRDPKELGIGMSVSVANGNPEDWESDILARKELGATHISVNTMRAGFRSHAEHLDAIMRCKEIVDSLT